MKIGSNKFDAKRERRENRDCIWMYICDITWGGLEAVTSMI